MSGEIDEVKQRYVEGDYEDAVRLHRQLLAQRPPPAIFGTITTVAGNGRDPLWKHMEQMEAEGHKAEEGGSFAEAARSYRQVFEILRVSLGDAHPLVTLAANNLGEALRKQKMFREAKQFLLEAVKGIASTNEGHRRTILANLAHLFLDICDAEAPDPSKDFHTAISGMAGKPPDYARSMRIRFPVPQRGEGSIRQAVRVIHARAAFYESLGDRRRSLFLLQIAAEMTRATFSVDAESLAESLLGVAAFLLASGDVAGAAATLEEVKDRSQAGGQSPSNTAAMLIRQAHVLSTASKHEAAEKFLMTALDIIAARQGPDSPDTLPIEEDLFVVHMRLGREDTKDELRRIVERYRKDPHKKVGDLQRFASYLMQLGEYVEAEDYYRQILETQRDEIGEWHPDYALTLSNSGSLYRFTGRFAEAEPLFRRATTIRRMEYGPYHPSIMDSLVRLALTLAALGRWEEAFGAVQDALSIGDRWLSQVSGISSESTRLNLIREQIRFLNIAVSILHAAGDHAFVAEVFQWVLKRKALAIAALAAQRTAVLGGRYPHLCDRLIELDQLKADIVQQFMESARSARGDASSRMHDTIERKESLESQLAGAIPEMKLEALMANASIAAVAAGLPMDSVLIEFLAFDPYNFAGIYANNDPEFLPRRYLAFVLHAFRPNSVNAVDLGEAGEIDNMIETLNRSTSPHGRMLGPNSDITGTLEPGLETELAERVFGRLQPRLGGRSRLLLAPDGQLHLLAFDMLPLGADRLVIDAYELSYLGTGRDVLRFASRSKASQSTALIMADPDFDLTSADSVDDGKGQSVNDGRRLGIRGSLGDGGRFEPLPGTRLEGERISRVLPTSLVRFGKAALESEVRHCVSPRVLHCATHGFFLSPTSGVGPSDYRQSMYSSGLAFAGANTYLAGHRLPPDAEDGILTAEDVATLNLLETELVVLSACETALGEILNGEGVFGLRRAFFMAGARTVIMSLWKVPDIETADLMVAFYEHLGNGMQKPAALRNAKLMLRATGAPASAWAAFICEGDWQPLKEPVRM